MDLLALIEKYPDRNWNVKELSSNTSITIEILAKFNDWDWDALSSNPGTTNEMVLRYADKPWNFVKLSWNHSITLDIFLLLPEKPWDWFPAYKGRAIHLGFGKQDMSLPWPWKEVSKHPELTLDFVDQHSNKDWDWVILSHRFTFTKEFLEKHSDKPLDWWAIYSKQSKLVVEVLGAKVSEKISYFWNRILNTEYPSEPVILGPGLSNLSHHLNNSLMELFLVAQFSALDWNWGVLSHHPQLTLKFVEMHINKAWDWNVLSTHENFDLVKCLEKDYPWNYDLIPQHPKFTPDLISRYPDRPWNYEPQASLNLFDLVDKYPNKPWNWSRLTVFHNMHTSTVPPLTVLPMRNTYYYKKAFKLPVVRPMNHYPKELEKTILLPFPAEMLHEISFMVYGQN